MEKSKVTTKTYYVCTCGEKMETIAIGKGNDLFGFSGGNVNALYCNNSKCEKFGYLTIAGIKKED
jgi:hypothetical protein